MPGFFGKTKIVPALFLFFFLFCFCFESQAEPQKIPRKILALYKSSENRTEENNEIVQMAQLPLNNLGLIVEYRNAEEQLPDLQTLKDYRGIITWFTSSQMVNAHKYRIWLYQIINKLKLPVVILGHLGAYSEYGQESKNSDILETTVIFNSLGFKSSLQSWTGEALKISYKDTSFFDFETTVKQTALTTLLDVTSNSQQNKILFSLTDQNRQNDAAVLSPKGAYIQSEIIYKQITGNGQNQWYLNPFKLFSEVFSCDSFPAIEINSIGGKRTAFIHIDGDGFSTISKIDRWHLCAQLLQTRIIRRYPLPYSVSVIAAEIDSNYMGSEETIKTARELFSRANVEAASHGFAHPFDWRTGKLELDSIPNYSFDPEVEIGRSAQYIRNNLLPPAKSVDLLFWSGMCNPTAGQIQIAENSNLLQINGGAGQINLDYPSISNFAPPYSQVENRFRINARISNEYEFTNLWNGPYNGYKDVIQSIKFTEIQNTIPVDIYFHFYSLEFNESWKALRDVIKYVSFQDWNFLYTSQYVKMVKDFIRTEIFQTGEHDYRVDSAGFSRTIRFPNEKRRLNLSKSENLLGFTYSGNDLIVHLDSNEFHKICFEEPQVKKSYLQSFNRMVDLYSSSESSAQIKLFGYGNFKATVKDLPAGQPYEISVVTSLKKEDYQQNKIANLNKAKLNKHYKKLYAKSTNDGELEIETFISNRTIITISQTDPFNLKLAKIKYYALGLVLVVFLSGQFVLRKKR